MTLYPLTEPLPESIDILDALANAGDRSLSRVLAGEG